MERKGRTAGKGRAKIGEAEENRFVDIELLHRFCSNCIYPVKTFCSTCVWYFTTVAVCDYNVRQCLCGNDKR